jgi:hypothetical protein
MYRTCGCETYMSKQWGLFVPMVEYCPMHEAAPELLKMLETCYEAIKSLDNDAFGNVPDKSPTEQGRYARDELLHNIAGIIHAAKGESNE